MEAYPLYRYNLLGKYRIGSLRALPTLNPIFVVRASFGDNEFEDDEDWEGDDSGENDDD